MSILHNAVLRACFLQLPGTIHRCCFFCGSLAVYFDDEGEGRKRKLQLNLSKLSKYRGK